MRATPIGNTLGIRLDQGHSWRPEYSLLRCLSNTNNVQLASIQISDLPHKTLEQPTASVMVKQEHDLICPPTQRENLINVPMYQDTYGLHP
jgi:hypothetical protein